MAAITDLMGSIIEILVVGDICSSVSTFDKDKISSINLFILFASSSIIFKNFNLVASSCTSPESKVSIKPTKLVKGDLNS